MRKLIFRSLFKFDNFVPTHSFGYNIELSIRIALDNIGDLGSAAYGMKLIFLNIINAERGMMFEAFFNELFISLFKNMKRDSRAREENNSKRKKWYSACC